MERFNSVGLGWLIALLVLFITIVLGLIGSLDKTLVGLISGLAIARLLA